MFIGHYGVSFAAKGADRRLPLWLLFIAMQWLDVVWSGLVMLNVEKMRLVPGFTASNDMDLYYMPYTHGLVGALALSAALGAVTSLFYRQRRAAAAAVVAGAVFSHWLLDLVVHVQDLPLLGDGFKVGFGLWRYRAISFTLEIAVLAGGAWLYARAVPSRTRAGDTILWVFVAALAAVQVYGTAGPAPQSPVAEAQTALAAYLGLALLAGLADWARGTPGTAKAPPLRPDPAR